ncbi:hypothetical protein HNP68_001055 [Borrelia yangtzensis]|uniref:Uncharacterized protein n=1 Tax=Borreliella yangtzensis TaxID=683292 RepID=A0ABR6PBE1_9SPIR|nr:hypothetical protein [Borreliella yangtzensis]
MRLYDKSEVLYGAKKYIELNFSKIEKKKNTKIKNGLFYLDIL